MNRYVHPLRIGGCELANNLCLAPMAGFTNVAFRLIAKSVGGCGLVASEMVAALGDGGVAKNRRWEVLTRNLPEEKPLAMQVYGRDPDRCARTAAALVEAGADIVDLNCGCPVRKAKQAGCGVALMREPGRVGAILAAMRAAVPASVPVTVKMRLGYSTRMRTCHEVADAAVAAGAAAIFIHARTGENKHGTDVDLAPVSEVRRRVPVPVVVNGSMDTAAAIRRAKDEAGADGYQIGRAACGDPWLFRNLVAELTGEPRYEPSLEERRELLLRHFELVLDLFGEERGVRVMRKYASFYCQGLPGVRAYRNRFVRIESPAEFHGLVEKFFASLRPGRGAGPVPARRAG